MKLGEIKTLLNCQVLFGPVEMDVDITHACASDLMSDILICPRPGSILITGLANNQAVRTSKIARAAAILFVRNKKPSDITIQLAKGYGIPLLSTDLSMFETCGILFSKGIQGLSFKNIKHATEF